MKEKYIRNKKYRLKHPEKMKEVNANKYSRSKEYYIELYSKNRPKYKNIRLKNRYGITLNEYNKILNEQNGVCAICGKINKNGRALAVDHNHKTDEVRGLLCNGCNTGIGFFLEDIIFYIMRLDI